jgi:hypothetical protein
LDDGDEAVVVARSELSPEEMGKADAWEIDQGTVTVAVGINKDGHPIRRVNRGLSFIEFTYFAEETALATDMSDDVEFVRFEGRLRFRLASVTAA